MDGRESEEADRSDCGLVGCEEKVSRKLRSCRNKSRSLLADFKVHGGRSEGSQATIKVRMMG